MTTILAFGESAPAARGVADYIGNPMYRVISEHRPALAAVMLAVVVAWLVRRSVRKGGTRFATYVDGYRELGVVHQFWFWLMAVAGTIHLGLVFGHEPGGYTIAYLVGAVAEFWVARRLLLGRRWRGRAAAVLGASLLAYVVSNLSGEPPDQVGLATKLIEITALWVVVTAPTKRRLRRLVGSSAMLLLSVLVATAAWVGAFSGVEESHHLGEASQPGTLVPAGEDRAETAPERDEAEDLYHATLASVARYEDLSVAAADGYNVEGMYGRDFHAANEAFKRDGRILDPNHPENLIYSVTPRGPVLVGVLFEMEGIGKPGPAIGGPLTVWHAHDNVCFALTPLTIAGLTSPFGVCPMGSLTIPITNEMLHVWTYPGAPERFGHLDDERLDSYLRTLAG